MSNPIIQFSLKAQALLNTTQLINFIAPLAMRLFLVPIFWVAGYSKLTGFKESAAWFGNKEWGLGLPAPEVMLSLALTSELLGAVLLLLGFAVRWICIPLMITMLVAISTVHWQHGWFAISDAKSCLFNCQKYQEATVHKEKAIAILKQHGDYDWLTQKGSFVILNNGIEFGVTYLIMLLMLFFYGPGAASVDALLARKYMTANTRGFRV